MSTINNVVNALNNALPTIYGVAGGSCNKVASKELFMALQAGFNAVCQETDVKLNDTYPQFCGKDSNWKANESKQRLDNGNYVTTLKTYTYFFPYDKNEYAIQASNDFGFYSMVLYKDFFDPRDNSHSYKEVASVTDHCSKWLMARDQSREDMLIIDYGIKLATGIDPRICFDGSAMDFCSDEI